jgi:hypothetical protein
MQRWILLAFLAFLSLTADAAKRVAVSQLEQSVAAASAAHTFTSESQIIDIAAESEVTISSIDARGLYTTSPSVSEQQGTDLVYQADIRRRSLEAAENPLSELANGTGGTFFHNSNDLDAGLKSLVDAPEYVYTLELSLDGVKADGDYHRLR